MLQGLLNLLKIKILATLKYLSLDLSIIVRMWYLSLIIIINMPYVAGADKDYLWLLLEHKQCHKI